MLRTEHIVKTYAHHTALDDVSIEVPPQSIFGLLGPNGAGKTSLIRIINQITGPDSGKVFLNNEPLQPKHIEMIGYLPEERGLYKKMKVGEQAIYLAMLKGMDRKVAKEKLIEWFKRFDIINWWNKKVEELSKGMAQKVQFIVTVLHEPKLLILDEPFSGFDPINTQIIKNEILSLKEKGTTVIFSTHNMSSVEEICDHIALINRSKKILDGKVNEIRQEFKDNTWKVEFKGQMIAFTNSLWTAGEIIDKQTVKDVNSVIIKLDESSKINQVLQNVLSQIEIISVNEILPSMNDIFIKKVSEINSEVSAA
jgi:ABC-2 type transport system ATP-binding protein